MLLEFGNTICNNDWKVDEKIPPGYSRVYYVYSGEIVYEDDQLKTILKPGYLYIFPSAATYRIKQDALRPLHCTFIHIEIYPSLPNFKNDRV